MKDTESLTTNIRYYLGKDKPKVNPTNCRVTYHVVVFLNHDCGFSWLNINPFLFSVLLSQGIFALQYHFKTAGMRETVILIIKTLCMQGLATEKS